MNFDLKFYGQLIVRRLPVMLLLFLVSSGLGLVFAIRLPATYESTARLVVQPQQIAEDLVASTVQMNPLEEVRLLQERVMTRANLIDIAHNHRVFENMDEMVPGAIVDGMRGNTDFQASGRTGQPVLVSITFSARNAQIAADVVNEYVTRLTAENVRARTGAASETLEFFEREVERLGTELELRSNQITEFQRENADALPNDQEFRLQRVALMQERIAAAERERRNLTNTRERLMEIFQATGRLPGAAQANMTPEQRQLAQLEEELAQALTIYSETAPQVVALNRRVETLRGTVSRQLGGTGESGASDAETLLNLQLAEIDTRIEALDTLIEESQAETQSLEAAIAASPLNAITLQGLERDYGNIRMQYDSAVQGLSQASMGERIEVTARGQRISLIEPAAVSDSPASPNRTMIAAGGMGLGFALAAGFFLLAEFLNKTVRRPAEIVSALGISPLATLPYLESPRERLFRRAGRITAAVVVLVGVPVGLWAIDSYYLPLDLLAERLIDRIGLG